MATSLGIHTVSRRAAAPERESWELTRDAPPLARVVSTRAADGTEAWPTSTDLCCWHCCHAFDGPPVPLPVSHDPATDTFIVTGTFCSFSCAKAYNSDNMKRHVSTMHLLTLLKKRATGKLGGIAPAPPRRMLSMFGGQMSIDEFRSRGESGECCSFLPAKMMAFEEVPVLPSGAAAPSAQPVFGGGGPAARLSANACSDVIFMDQDDAVTGAAVRRKGRTRKATDAAAAAKEPAIQPEQLRLKRTSFLPTQGTLDSFLGGASSST